MRLLLALAIMVSSTDAYAQGAAEADAQTVVDDSPFANARAAALGGALSPVAEGAEAIYYNPAGIGGIGNTPRSSIVRQLHFPYAAMSYNQNSKNLYDDFEAEGGKADPVIGSAVMDAHAGKRQYARFSFFPNIVFGRLMLGPIMDQQLAAVPSGTDGVISTRFVQSSGFMAGTSVSDPRGRLMLGISGGAISREEVRGDFLYTDMVDTATRSAAIKDYTNTYSGMPLHSGILWRVSQKSSTTLSLAIRDMGGTTYTNSKSENDDLEIAEDMTIGLGMSPRLGKWGQFNFVVEGGRLSDNEVAINEKLRASTELNLGGAGSAALMALRAGYNFAGASYGANLNLGILGAGYSSHAEDIGIGNQRVIERRHTFVFTVNVAE